MPQARRIVREALDAEWGDLAADAELVVSELVTNAALHGEPPVRVTVLAGDRIRVEVGDEGRSAPILLRQNTDAMTGRGLAMVAALTSAWGVDPAPSGGKVVWAELGGQRDAAGTAASAGRDIEALLAAWSDDELSPTTHAVRLGAVSTDLLLSAKAHIDNVVRELTLLREGESSRGKTLPPDLEALVETVTVDFAAARSEIKRQAAAAAARGDELTRLELHLPASAAEAGERYLIALDQADRYARASNLLTMAAPRPHRLFRQWYVGSLVDQLRSVTRGQKPAPPRSFQVVLAEEISHLEEKADVFARLSLLQTVTAELVEAQGQEEMARVVVDNAVRFLGVETARVRLITDGVLRSVAWRSRDPSAVDHGLEYSVDSDLPGALAVQTGQPQFTRSLRQTLQSNPEFADKYESGQSAHVVPLTVGDETLGILSLTFLSGELSDRDEFQVIDSLADALAQVLRRAHLAAREDQQRETLDFLADALGILISAAEPAEVLERLVAHAVPRLTDWCTVYVVEGSSLRRAAVAVEGFPELSEQAKDGPSISLDADIPHTRVLRTGRPEPIYYGVGDLLETLYPQIDFGSIGTDWSRASGLCAPIELRGRRVGVIAVTFLRGDRRVTPEVARVLSGLADRAAIAMDIAQLRSGRRQPAEQTRLERAVSRAGLLTRATEELAAIIDPDEAMRAVARLIVPDLADWSIVTLIDGESQAGMRRGLRSSEAWHARPERRDLVTRYAARRLDVMADDSLVVRAVESGEPQVIPSEAMTALRSMFPPGADALGLLEQLRPNAVAVLPLKGREQPVGLLTLCRDGPRRFDPDDLDLARDLAARAGLVLDRARLYRQQREVSETLQRSMLTDPPVTSSAQIAVRYVPAAEAAQVGGDWYDAFQQEDGSVVLVIGDVMGHDFGAAAAMGQVRTLLRGIAAHGGRGPAQVLQDVERTVSTLRLDTPATAVVARLEPGPGAGPGRSLRWSNAGHPPPIRLDPDGTTTVLGSGTADLLLGAPAGPTRQEHVVELPVGSTVVLYTDGLVEQRDQSLESGLDRLQAVLSGLGGSGAEELCDEVLRQMLPDRPGDDVALLAVRITGT